VVILAVACKCLFVLQEIGFSVTIFCCQVAKLHLIKDAISYDIKVLTVMHIKPLFPHCVLLCSLLYGHYGSHSSVAEDSRVLGCGTA
jgi:hypothetical protein